MKHLLYLLLIFACLPVKAQETYSISGTVTDKKGEPVPGATAFLANTKNNTSTTNDGKFQFGQLQAGNYELVIKMFGFTEYHQAVVIQKSPVNLSVKLAENNIQLKTVTISGMSKEERQELLQSFIKNFIGESDYAAKCKILNPDVLNFTRNRLSFEATSDDFLVIENKALGYKIHYLLSQFKLEYYDNRVYYNGSYYFEELKGSPSEQRNWEKNRQLVYEGSLTHFYRAAFNNMLKQEGFWLYRYPNQEALQVRKKKQERIKPEYFLPLSDPGSLFTSVDENTKMLDFRPFKKDSTELYVFYVKRGEPASFIEADRQLKILINVPFNESQVSVIRPLADSILLHSNGAITPFNGLVRGGYWTWNMAAGFLPDDYRVPTNEKH